MPDKDANDFVKDDVSKLKSANLSGGVGLPHPKKAIETVCWGFSLLSLAFMLVALPFAGPNKPLSGEAWIALSMTGILLFGGTAVTVRLFFPEGHL